MILKIKRGELNYEKGFEVYDKDEKLVLTVEWKNDVSGEKMIIKDSDEKELFYIHEFPFSEVHEYMIYSNSKEVAKVKSEYYKVIPTFEISSSLGDYRLKRTIHNGLELYDGDNLAARAFIKIVGFGEYHTVDIEDKNNTMFIGALLILIFRMGKRHFVQ